MQYQVQPGDTIAKVTQQLNTRWDVLRQKNPHAIGRSSRTGRWFLKEGATVTIKESESFQAVLQQKVETQKPPATVDAHAEGSEQWRTYTVKPGDNLWTLAIKKFHVNLDDLIRDNNIKNPQLLQPGQRVRIRKSAEPSTQEVTASWYGQKYHGKMMANGDRFDMNADTIAHKALPLGTKVVLTNPETGQSENAEITDRGPYISGRDVDLSYGLARKLSMVRQGVGKLMMRIL
jgi:peptidoglycan lytic transglycosylase